MEEAAQPPAIVGTFVNDLNLPSGGHVVLRDPLELRAKDRRAVQKAVTDLDRKMSAGLELLDGAICMLVASWTLPYLPNAPLPSQDPSVLESLTIPDQMALEDAASPAMRILFPGEAKVDDAQVPGSPTGPASA